MIRVGTSGFTYDHWKGVFYPNDLPHNRWLEFYAERFDCVEINSTFYHMPAEKTLTGWLKRTPRFFRFVLKGSRLVTHRKLLRDCAEPVKFFYDRARLLEDKLGPVLWQFPPQLEVDLNLLKDFLELLPPQPPAVLEFRNPGWFINDVYELLQTAGVSLCVHDMPESLCPDLTIGPLLYLRFHGPGGEYRGNYADDFLEGRADWVRASAQRHVYAFFNNDFEGCAVQNAVTFRKLLSGPDAMGSD